MLIVFIILSLLLPSTCLERIKFRRPEARYPGDSYPYCVDVVRVYPPPLSLLQPDTEGKLTFRVQFSRPVVYHPDTQYYENNEFEPGTTKDAYLTPSLSKMQKVGGPISVNYTGDSYLWRKYVFQLTQDEIKMISKLYFIIDGEQLYVESYLLNGVMTTFVPLSIFGEYYIDPALAAGKTSKQIERTLHCDERLRRPLPDPYHEDPVQAKISISIVSDPQAHTFSNNDELRLSLKASGAGDKTIELPERVKGIYNGINVSIGIPSGLVIRIKRDDIYYRVPVKTKIIHEVYERVYHTRTVLPVQRRGFTSHLPQPNRQDVLNLVHDSRNGIYTLKTAQTSFPLLIAVRFSGNNYAFYSREGGIWRLKSDPYGPDANFRFFEPEYNVPAFYSRECDQDSLRTRPTMKRGLTVHAYELGPYYRLVEPDMGSVNRWLIRSNTRIYLQSKDITVHASFGVGSSFYDKRIPKFLYDALNKYVVLIRPLSHDFHNFIIPLDEGIFVPRSQLHKDCGGLLMFENENYIEGNDFCEKKIGSCTGLPWTSTERFPVIPPFNIPGLAGWTYDRSKMASYFGVARHPISFHFEDWVQTIPKAFYYSRDSIRYIFLSGQDSSTDYIAVPISGVRLLSPNLDLSSCSNVWSINEVLDRETTLTIYLNNNGLGGADVTVQVLCTIGLIVVPSNGAKTQWVEGETNDRVTFKLDATLVATKEIETHYCHLNISVHSIQTSSKGLECPKVAIKSYAGLFTDPCKLKKTPLPGTALKYFVLPRSQLNESSGVTISTLLTTGPEVLVFMRAISVILTVSREEYLLNLLKVVVHCENPNVLVIEEEEAEQEALLLLLKRIQVASFWNKKPINLYSSLLKRRRFYFFAVRKWLLQTNGTVRAPSGCSVKIVANRPHRLCNRPETIDEVYVPLIQADIGYITNQKKGEFWYVEPIYGKQSKGVIVSLFLCIGILVLFSLLTGSGHATMLIFRKQLPSLKKKSKLRRKIDQLKAIDKKSWEMPQMYLEEGKYGPHYILHNFKCTDSLSTCDLKSLKVAGQLKYEEKELQVLFGHVKNIYKRESDHSGDIWLQASSGWYLLQASNVSPEYVDHLNDFYRDSGIKMEVMKRE